MTQTLPPVPAPLQSAPAAQVLPLQVSRWQRNGPQPAAGHPYRRTGLTLLLSAAATLHFVWFYLALVRCYLNLDSYESGTANTPYQYRLLLMLPLRWAHGSAACQSLAAALTSMRPWFPLGVRPESIVEFPLDVVSVILAGLVARQIYKSASPTGLLTPLVYPLTLLMVAATYAFGTMHRLRFLYDLPSLGFFAAGLYLLYFRKPRWQFALLFCIATLNRETTLFLLALFVLTRWLDTRSAVTRNTATCSTDTCSTDTRSTDTRSSATARDHGTHNTVTSPPHTPAWRLPRLPLADVALTAFLLSAWVFWHIWVAHHFSANPTESWSRLRLNLWILAVPASWLQLLSCFAFCGPVLLVHRRRVHDPTLRLWLWIVPLWVLCMLHYGLFVETRIFGELIPIVACCVALITEQLLLDRLHATRLHFSRVNPQFRF